MEYKKAKSRKDKLKEAGIAINYCRFTVVINKEEQRICETIYKQIKNDIHTDVFFIKRLMRVLKLENSKTKKYVLHIKKQEIIKYLGQGIYEE